MAERQHIEPSDQQTIGALLRRIEAARRFPDNTDPCVRHVQIMGETLAAGLPYPMLDEERGHCAISLLAVVAALYEARNAGVQGRDALPDLMRDGVGKAAMTAEEAHAAFVTRGVRVPDPEVKR